MRAKGTERRAPEARARGDGARRPAAGCRRSLSAPAFRRPEAARGDCARADAAAEADRVRRGGGGAGYVDPRRRAQSVRRAAARSRADLRLHHPRSRRGVAHQRTHRGDVSRQVRRARPDGAGIRAAAASLYAGAAVGRAAAVAVVDAQRPAGSCCRAKSRARSIRPRDAVSGPVASTRRRSARRRRRNGASLARDHWVACHFADRPNFSPN